MRLIRCHCALRPLSKPLHLPLAIASLATPALAQPTLLNTWGTTGTGNGQFNDPFFMAFAPNGNLYVTDEANARVQIFSPTGSFLSAFTTPATAGNPFSIPWGIATGNGNVYVVDFGIERVDIFNQATNTLVTSFGTSGTGNGQFNNPTGIGVSPSGNVYVSDRDNHRIEIFNSAGVFQSAFSTGNSQSSPDGIAFDASGNVYVADGNVLSDIDVFSPSGVLLKNIGTPGSPGSGNGQFNFESGLAFSANGRLYVADTSNNRIQIFDSSDNFVSAFGSFGSGTGQFHFPTDVAVSPSGMLYVTDTSNNRIQRYLDTDAWVSGINTFTDPTAGPTSLAVGSGQILGASFSLNPTMGLTVGGATTINADGRFTLAGGSLNTATLSISGQFLYQGGSLTASTLNINAGGSFLATGANVSVANVSISGNAAQLFLDGNALLSATTLTVSSGAQLSLGQATLSVPGSNITIAPGGEIFLNNPSTSTIQTGTLKNNGLLDGSGRLVGTLNNSTGGQLAVTPGQTITITGSGNLNSLGGTIALAGGTLHFLQDLINAAGSTINGYGVLRVDGLLTNSGNITFAGQASSVFANITNNASIVIDGTQAALFFNPITNNGNISIKPGASAIFFAAVTGNAPSSILSVAAAGAAVLSSNASVASSASALSLAGSSDNWTGTLDLTSNKLVIEAATSKSTTLATLQNQVVYAHTHTTGGGGITSSTLPANFGIAVLDNATTHFATFGGQTVDANSILISPELLGDANADGHVDLSDLSTVLNNFGAATPNWTDGNFDSAPTIDLTDLSDVLNDFGLSNPTVSNAPTTPVPEPAFLALLPAAFLLNCRRRAK